ncbi:MAG TPA: selenocysteine-specific translation elongation factor [Actinomycetota bacterium]|nr:selenocysteine-specific translation elongation factor [Actinomycetota bacterium]
MTDVPDGAEWPLHVVATAGHVDHGKSSLIVRLTGIDPDRLAEEKRRGLTIDLGFAWCTLPSGREIGFVDVPGHERFVRTMLAGVGPVRLVLLVVAADEGWKPQSEEHLAIVDVLGVDGAVVALTKRDLVDGERLALVADDVAGRLRGTALEGAPIVPCSAATGEGLDELAIALDAMVASAPAPAQDDRPRLFVDRVFTIRGAGTVATGTLTGGRLSVGDEVELFPTGRRARIRSLQTHKRSIEVARPVSRVAANLAGSGRADLARGDVLAPPGRWSATQTIEARLRPVRGLGRPLTARGAFKLHAGAAERDARVRLYGVREVGPDGAFARIRLSAPLVLDVGDRFVLRESGRRETVAGGVVLDVDPPARAGPAPEGRLRARETADATELPALVVRERGAVRASDLERLAGRPPGAAEDVVRCGAWCVAAPLLDAVAERLASDLERFHAEHPLAPGPEAAEVRRTVAEAAARSGAPRDADLANALLGELVDRGRVVREGSALRLPTHRASLAGHEAEVDGLVAAVASAEPTPPTVRELLATGTRREVLDAAVRAGLLVAVSPEVVLTPAFVDRALSEVRAAGEAGLTVSALRERLGTSRRYAVPLVEHLDERRLTRRVGDVRVARDVGDS